jgi:hypothetical protein
VHVRGDSVAGDVRISRSSIAGNRTSRSLATARTPATRFASDSASYLSVRLLTKPASVTTPSLTDTRDVDPVKVWVPPQFLLHILLDDLGGSHNGLRA